MTVGTRLRITVIGVLVAAATMIAPPSQALEVFLPRCRQWVPSVAKQQAPIWVSWMESGHADLRDWAQYTNDLSAIPWCGPDLE